jgi:hypothetical protein
MWTFLRDLFVSRSRLCIGRTLLSIFICYYIECYFHCGHCYIGCPRDINIPSNSLLLVLIS